MPRLTTTLSLHRNNRPFTCGPVASTCLLGVAGGSVRVFAMPLLTAADNDVSKL
jgi:hypothetical protein